MPDQSAVYVGTAFIAGVGLALVCKEVLSFQRSQKNRLPKNQLQMRSLRGQDLQQSWRESKDVSGILLYFELSLYQMQRGVRS
jgi:hypothetical protein